MPEGDVQTGLAGGLAGGLLPTSNKINIPNQPPSPTTTQTTPQTTPNVVAPQAPLTGDKIRVRRKSDGTIGTISSRFFNDRLYDKVEEPKPTALMQDKERIDNAIKEPLKQIFAGQQATQEGMPLYGSGLQAKGALGAAFSAFTASVEGWRSVPVVGPVVAKALTVVPEMADAAAKMGFSVADYAATVSGLPPSKRVQIISQLFNLDPKDTEKGLQAWTDVAEQLVTLGLIPKVGEVTAGAVKGVVEQGPQIVGQMRDAAIRAVTTPEAAATLSSKALDVPYTGVKGKLVFERPAETALKYGYDINKHTGLNMLTNLIDNTNKIRDRATSEAAGAGMVVDFSHINRRLRAYKRFPSNVSSTNYKSIVAAVDAVMAENKSFMERMARKYPNNPYGKVPLDEADAFRSSQVKAATDAYILNEKKVTPIEKAYRESVDYITDDYKKSLPALKEYGVEQRDLIELKPIMEKAIQRKVKSKFFPAGWLDRIVIRSAVRIGQRTLQGSTLGGGAGYLLAGGSGMAAGAEWGGTLAAGEALVELLTRDPEILQKMAKIVDNAHRKGFPRTTIEDIKPLLFPSFVTQPPPPSGQGGTFAGQQPPPPGQPTGAPPSSTSTGPFAPPSGFKPAPGTEESEATFEDIPGSERKPPPAQQDVPPPKPAGELPTRGEPGMVGLTNDEMAELITLANKRESGEKMTGNEIRRLNELEGKSDRAVDPKTDEELKGYQKLATLSPRGAKEPPRIGLHPITPYLPGGQHAMAAIDWIRQKYPNVLSLADEIAIAPGGGEAIAAFGQKPDGRSILLVDPTKITNFHGAVNAISHELRHGIGALRKVGSQEAYQEAYAKETERVGYYDNIFEQISRSVGNKMERASIRKLDPQSAADLNAISPEMVKYAYDEYIKGYIKSKPQLRNLPKFEDLSSYSHNSPMERGDMLFGKDGDPYIVVGFIRGTKQTRYFGKMVTLDRLIAQNMSTGNIKVQPAE